MVWIYFLIFAYYLAETWNLHKKIHHNKHHKLERSAVKLSAPTVAKQLQIYTDYSKRKIKYLLLWEIVKILYQYLSGQMTPIAKSRST